MRPAFFVIAFVVLALAESVLGLVQPRLTASPADWRAASSALRASFERDDLIVFSPDWLDPVGREHLGDLMPASMLARSDADRYARIWQLGPSGAPAPDGAAGASLAVEQAFGRLRLRRYDKTAVKITRDFTADFASARVFTKAHRDGADEHPCLSDGDARRCSATRVERRVVEVDYRPRLGVLVPVAGSEVTTLEYEGVQGAMLVGYAGLHDYYARKNADGVAIVRVRVDATQSVTVPVHNEDGWKRFELPLEPGPHRVLVEVESDRPQQRFVGVHVEVRAP